MQDLSEFKELTEPELKRWTYPGGEVGVRFTGKMPESLLWRIQSSDDLMALLMLPRNEKCNNLFIPYIPYARQDRAAFEGDVNAIRQLAWIILQTMPCIDSVTSLDIHSKETKAAFEAWSIDFVDLDPSPYLNLFLERIGLYNDFVFISPDKGAEEKTRKYAAALCVDQVIVCVKEREPETGKLKGFYVKEIANEGHAIAPNNTFVIVDDICDGGRTFFGVKQAVITALPELKDSKFALWTSHGIYSQGLDVLAKEFSFIGSTDSFKHGLTHPALVTIPLIQPKENV